MILEREKVKPYSKYIVGAIFGAVIVSIALTVGFKLFVFAFELLIKYWWGAIVGLFILLLLRKILGKKKKNAESQ